MASIHSSRQVSTLLVVSVAVFLLFMSFAIAQHVIRTSGGASTYSVNEDVGFMYNVSVNITDVGTNANVTEVNITIPSTLAYIADSANMTTISNFTFTNTSTVLSWRNNTYLINGSAGATLVYFWFNATASTPATIGVLNLTVTTRNITGIYQGNITLTINDSTVPASVTFVSPTNTSGIYTQETNFSFNATATDNGAIGNMTIYIYNSTYNLIKQNFSTSSPVNTTITGLSDGIYYFNVTVFDTFRNANSTSTRNITVDTTSPVSITINSPTGTVEDDSPTVNVSVSETASSCSFSLDGGSTNTTLSSENGSVFSGTTASIPDAGYTINLYCLDLASNANNSANGSFTVDYTPESSGGSGSSGGGGSSTPRGSTFVPSDAQLFSGYSRDLSVNDQVQMTFGGSAHKVLVQTVGGSSITVQVSSTPQTATISSGETKKFEVTGDNYYDVSVKLNSVSGTKASVTIATINEIMPPAQDTTPAEEQVATDNAAANLESPAQAESSTGSNLWKWIIGIIVVIVIVGVIIVSVQSKSKHR